MASRVLLLALLAMQVSMVSSSRLETDTEWEWFSGMITTFEDVTGIDVPDSIHGVTVPDVDIGDVFEEAQDFIDKVENKPDYDLVNKSVGMRSVVAKALHTAANCWGVIDQSQEIFSSIARDIQPVEPLLRISTIAELTGQLHMISSDNFDKAFMIIKDVLSLDKLLEKISGILEGVKMVFDAILKTCGDVIEKASEHVPDVAQAFNESLRVEATMQGVDELFAGIKGVASEFSDISVHLVPLHDHWLNSGYWTLTRFVWRNSNEIKDSLSRFWPAWEESQRQYKSSRHIGQSFHEGAKKAYSTIKPVVVDLCESFGIDVPGGPNGDDWQAKPSVMPREG